MELEDAATKTLLLHFRDTGLIAVEWTTALDTPLEHLQSLTVSFRLPFFDPELTMKTSRDLGLSFLTNANFPALHEFSLLLNCNTLLGPSLTRILDTLPWNFLDSLLHEHRRTCRLRVLLATMAGPSATQGVHAWSASETKTYIALLPRSTDKGCELEILTLYRWDPSKYAVPPRL
ncbi:hypothetical protein NM688_g3815 [Phlebia brevispora]|uniref:Uncharacterized protein n=1 Tax=Phlebia brevispora TaxID=194682 RepID=A0ACC1T4N6_9APHY|nr:hypothetical protein NM688_g3815 [Phlebia brevispora]